MEESILNSIKKQLNIPPSVEAFDQDILLLINSAFGVLHQLGVGPEEGFSIEDAGNDWSEFYDDPRLNAVKQYVYISVRMGFDPPVGSIATSFETRLKELEWRLIVASEEIRNEESGI